jgi:hypothetical protein
MDTNSHYGHLSVRDGRSLSLSQNFLVKPVGGCIPYGVSAPGRAILRPSAK